MSNLTPITYTSTIYPFGEPGVIQSNDWVLWDSDASNPLTLSFSSSLAVATVWIPQLTGPVTFYEGTSATGTPFYVSGGAGSEVVPMPVDLVDVTMVGSGGDMYVYYTSLVLDPFRQGVIGNQVTAVTGTLPILSSGGTQPNISLQVPLAIAYGGTGTATPVGVQAASGSGLIITGSFPDQTISTDYAGLGFITNVTATPPINSTVSGNIANISLTGVVAQANGGTGTASPSWANTNSRGSTPKGAGIAVTGNIFSNDPTTGWYFTNIGVTSLTGDSGPTITGDITLAGAGSISTAGSGSTITISVDGTKFGLPIYYEGGGSIGGTNPHIVIDDVPVSVGYSSGNTIGSTAVVLTGKAQFPGNNYSVTISVANTTGTPPVVVMEANSLTSSGFNITGYGSGGSGAGNINCHFIAIGS